MKVQVLVACMNQSDFSIVKRSNIQTDAIVVNQCDKDEIHEFDFQNAQDKTCHVKFINTTERGLSRSRNMAIYNATADLCLICDDDEVLDCNYETTIVQGFTSHPNCDIIAFKLNFDEITFSDKEYNVNKWNAGRIASVQIAFRNNNLIRSTPFNIKMGSGTGNGCGEENKFLLDCLKKRVQIKYIPSDNIARISTEESLWFKGYTPEYWINRGWIAKMLYGKFWGVFYIVYQILFRVKKRDNFHYRIHILNWFIKGFMENR